jgi:hypothetical protein
VLTIIREPLKILILEVPLWAQSLEKSGFIPPLTPPDRGRTKEGVEKPDFLKVPIIN